MTIRRLESGDFLVRVDCDLRSLGEKRMFVATDADGNPKCPEGVPIIVRFGRAQKLLKGILEGMYYSRTRLRAASRLPSARFRSRASSVHPARPVGYPLALGSALKSQAFSAGTTSRPNRDVGLLLSTSLSLNPCL